MKKIGFIGTGVMGSAMAANLMKAGFELSVYTRTKSKAEGLISAGARWCDSIGELVIGQDAVISIIGYPEDVEQVYFSPEGVLSAASEGQYLIDMTTTSPALSKQIYTAAAKKGAFALDAPVSGGDTGARAGTLSIMVGGDKDTFEVCRPIFEAMGKTIIYEGPAGNGQHTKAANQIVIAGAVAGVAEAIAYAREKGLELQTMFDSISQGAAGGFQLSYNGKKMIDGDKSAGFFLKHFVKDMKIASDEAQADGLELPILKTVLAMYQELEERGLGNEGTQALIEYYK